MHSEDKLSLLSGVVFEESLEFTLDEISHACAVHSEYIIELVDEGVLAPAGREPILWRFTGVHMQQVTVASRLQSDLGVNLAGVALILPLLDEVNMLRARINAIEAESM